jgi:hypothetical protein
MSTTKMKVQPNARTPINITVAEKLAWCHRCKKDVQPRVIIGAFVSNPLRKCPFCRSVIQK